MAALPQGLNIDALPGPTRGASPALYFRDEVVQSPTGNRFALAYTIYEASMCNEVGHVAWGQVVDGQGEIRGNPVGLIATCWYTPWCVWLHESAFVFKTQRYTRRRLHIPLIVVDFDAGFAVLPGTDNAGSRPSHEVRLPSRYRAIGDGQGLLAAIEGDA